MVTIFSTPKPFRGDISWIQRNAIKSWTQLRPACEVILFGDDEGTREAAKEFGARHIPDLKRNEHGTPLVRDVFSEAEKQGSHSILCYINADIILLSDFLSIAAEVLREYPHCLLVGQRTNLDVPALLGFSSGWEERLRKRVKVEGILEAHNALDYFVFPRGLWGQIPPFAIGRTMWDQWFIYQARSQGVPVIDGTERITVVHQHHGYGHYPGGKDGVWNGSEAQNNMVLAGGLRHAYTLRDATHRLTRHGVKSRPVPYDLKRCLVLPITTHRFVRPFVRLAKLVALGARS